MNDTHIPFLLEYYAVLAEYRPGFVVDYHWPSIQYVNKAGEAHTAVIANDGYGLAGDVSNFPQALRWIFQ